MGKQSQLLLKPTEVELGLQVGVEFDNRLICLKKSTNQGQPLVFKNETVDISVEWANLSQLLLWQELKAWLSCSSEFTGMRGWIVSLKCKIRLALTATYYS